MGGSWPVDEVGWRMWRGRWLLLSATAGFFGGRRLWRGLRLRRWGRCLPSSWWRGSAVVVWLGGARRWWRSKEEKTPLRGRLRCWQWVSFRLGSEEIREDGEAVLVVAALVCLCQKRGGAAAWEMEPEGRGRRLLEEEEKDSGVFRVFFCKERGWPVWRKKIKGQGWGSRLVLVSGENFRFRVFLCFLPKV